MYFNDVHILYYVLIGVIGAFIGQLSGYLSNMFIEEKKVLSKHNFKEYNKLFGPRYLLIILIALSYIAILYTFGLDTSINKNIDLIKFLFLIPILICILIIDYKKQIIPNRINLTMFEIGLIFLFFYGWTNINIVINMLLGMIAGGGIFLIITLIGGLIAGREAMGLGDVKLMAVLGLYFGLNNILIISVMAFLIGAIISIILMILKKHKSNEYIPFGPFIVTGAIISVFVPFNILFNILMEVFSLGIY